MEVLLAKLFLVSFVVLVLTLILDFSKKIFYNIDTTDVFAKNKQKDAEEKASSSPERLVHSRVSGNKTQRDKKDRYVGRYADYKEFKKYKKI